MRHISQSVNDCIVKLLYLKNFLAKEIRLKHKAPVLSIVVLDGANQSIGHGSNIPFIESRPSTSDLPFPTNSENVLSHKVLICSEEQFKVKTE